MKKEVDLRGLSCPEPVLKTKKLIDDSAVMTVEALVDSEVNVQNLARLARSQNLDFGTTRVGDHHKVTINRNSGEKSQAPAAHSHSTNASPQTQSTGGTRGGGTVLFISKDTFGHGADANKDHDFSLNLMNVFLQTATQSGHEIRAVLMANSGVKLMDPAGQHLKVLNELKERGTEVLACGLCLDYYGLKEKVPTEQIANMFAICEYLFAADQVLSP